MLISSRSINKHGRHRQFMFMIVCILKKSFFLCGKGDNSNLNIDTMNWITDKYVNKHGRHRQLFFLIGQFLKIFYSDTAWPKRPKLGRKHLEGPLWELLILLWSINKHGRHRQFLFLFVRFLKQLFLWNRLAKWCETW